LRHFLEDWLAFDNTTWAPSDDKMDRLLVIVTYDESEGRGQNDIYTVFLGRMVKNQQVTANITITVFCGPSKTTSICHLFTRSRATVRQR